LNLSDCLKQNKKLLFSLEYCEGKHRKAVDGNIGRDSIIGIQSTLLTGWPLFYNAQKIDHLRIQAIQAAKLKKEKKKKWIWSAIASAAAYILGSTIN
jgi:hypothetical protein